MSAFSFQLGRSWGHFLGIKMAPVGNAAPNLSLFLGSRMHSRGEQFVVNLINQLESLAT